LQFNGLFDNNIFLLERMLDLKSLRHDLIASNIANVDTPHYFSKDLDFDRKLLSSLEEKEEIEIRRTHYRHLSIDSAPPGHINPKIISQISEDGLNSVDIDREMTKLAENQLMYNSLIKMISWKFNEMKAAISEGRR